MAPKRMASQSIVSILQKRAKQEKSNKDNSALVITLSDDSDQETHETLEQSSSSTCLQLPSPTSASSSTCFLPSPEKERSILLYEELKQLSFPLNHITEEKRMRLMNTPSVNNTKTLVQRRQGQSDCQLDVKKYTQMYSKWLVVGDDGALCKVCKLFISDADIPQSYGKFLSKPWTSYSRTRDLRDHEENSYHQNAQLAFYNRLSISTGKQPPVTALLSKQKKIDLENRRKRLDSVVRTLIFCARQGIALRGHCNEATPRLDHNLYRDGIVLGDINRGNFQQLLEFRMQSGDVNVDVFINKKSLYTSPDVQNTLLNMIADQVINKVVQDVKLSPYFSIISDETRDASNVEQLCIALRYYDVKLERTNEAFLCFLSLQSLKGTVIANAILNKLKMLNLPLNLCVGQAYDGASNMSGAKSGAAAIIQQEQPLASYVHCKSHQLNLVLMKSCKSNLHISDMMNTQALLCSFFNDSPKRQAKLTQTIQSSEYVETNKTKLCSLSQTRWVERYTAIESTVTLLPYIVDAFESMLGDGEYRNDWNNLSNMLRAVSNFKFVYTLVVTCNITAATKKLCERLQGRDLDVAQAQALIESTKTRLECFRDACDHFRLDWFQQAETLAKKLGIDVTIPRKCGRQLHRENVPAESAEQYYARIVTIPFLDLLINEYNRRFDKSSFTAYKLLNILPSVILAPHCKSDTDVWCTEVFKIASNYMDFLPSPVTLKSEMRQWMMHCVTKWKDLQVPEDISVAITESSCMGFQNITELLKIISVMPITSSEAERCFSRLSFLKNELRSTMGDKRLNSLATIMMHRERDIEINDIITKYLNEKGHL